MVKYTLTYFKVRGYAEPIRQMFKLADVDFEDVRLTYETDWADYKSKTPFGQLPVLSVDGFDIPQSVAIARYVARKFGFAGKTPEEEAWVDALVDQFKDFTGPMRSVIMAKKQQKSEADVEKIREEVLKPAMETYFNILKKQLEKSKSGFLVGDSVTFADLTIAENLYSLHNAGFTDLTKEPQLFEFKERIHGLPKLKEWIATRPITEF
ncbi:unnamed protein product [Caenorhabditis bovis]|uniref:glutathione transferase n=1 Tax=Caenorhabditis bovis TaxID=2654633 RepID=A0A8S1F1T7_9PELO|nr:unnamed protein product [Caenorhabditis bovis]